jgi:hypothetical protein
MGPRGYLAWRAILCDSLISTFAANERDFFPSKNVMRFVLEFLSIYTITLCKAIELPCNFTFSHVNGYSCHVVNFTNLNRHAYVTKVVGNHPFLNEHHYTTYHNRSGESVVRVTIWNEKVHYLPGNLCLEFPHLKNLQVKKCNLKALTRSTELNGLRRMYFGFNEIDQIPVKYFWHFCRLQILSLHGNKIHEIPKMAFRDLINLSSLSLGGNLLRDLHPNLFVNCISLEYIDLDRNFLNVIEADLFANLTMLKGVYLRNNNIMSIGNNFLSTNDLAFALFTNNVCIRESFNRTAVQPYNDFGYFKMIFKRDCSPPVQLTTETPPPTTTQLTKKPEYQRQKIYYFENCKWYAPERTQFFR